jgi:hypothetical protein
MIEFIKHRVNRIDEVNKIAPDWGVEVDLRSSVDQPGKLHLSHDPWTRGDDFEQWLQVFSLKRNRGTLILNTKEDGLEVRALELIKQYSIDRYFFLDTALPTLVRWAFLESNRHFAIRVSQYEHPDSISVFRGKAEWVWVDCFDGKPIDSGHVKALKNNFRVCLVSPELQAKGPQDLSRFRDMLPFADAICTKDPDSWKKLILGENLR